MSNSEPASPITLSIAGAGGRMGCRLTALAAESPYFRVTGAFEARNHPAVGRDAGLVAGCGELKVLVSADPDRAMADAQVLIDFTTPSALAHYLDAAKQRRAALVIGSTGLKAEEERLIEEAARVIPVIASPNMSIGVNLLFRLVPEVATALGEDYDIEIIETHHNQKKDSPSGTALGLLQRLLAVRPAAKEHVTHGRAGVLGARPRHEIGMHAVRAGDTVGDHTVLFATAGERIEITHRATSRDTFARGALRAAAFLAGKPPGRYSLADVMSGRASA